MNTLNLLRIYESLSDIHTEFFNSRKYTSVFPANTMTSFYFKINKLDAAAINDIDIYLVDGNENLIDFKTIVPSGELILVNDHLIYKNNTAFSQELEGLYYFQITDGVFSYYSNKMMFGNINIGYKTETMDIVYSRNSSSDPFRIYLKCSLSSSITINWGDGNITTQNATTSLTLFEHNYSADGNYTIEIRNNLNRITGLMLNESQVTSLVNVKPLINLEELDLQNIGLISFPFNELFKLKSVNVANSQLRSITGLQQSPIESLNITYCPSVTDFLTQNIYVQKLNSLETLIAEYCELSFIANGTISGSNGSSGVNKLQSIKIAHNKFKTLPLFGEDQGGGYFVDMIEYDISYNNLMGDVRNYILTASQPRFFIYTNIFNFSYNNLAKSFVDYVIERVATFNTDLANVNIDFRGYAAINGLNNASPTLGILTATIVNGGTGWVIGNTITPTNGGGTGCVVTVTAVNSGVITGVSVTSKGQGYTSIPDAFSYTGSGIGANISMKTGKLIITGAGGTVNHN